ncbi:abscisic acid 8'-hydroxylase 2-like [Cocos nucifera]|uniref:Abscisic acid 8'-hydroxylase 2-like n=1 Tax=Cocos nucifera TaxID=13894 RepID=A0A8K0IAQ9_COCNU|nr:abscisic acid 8'-hydroxylase 2-like [Cocos nucifera]
MMVDFLSHPPLLLFHLLSLSLITCVVLWVLKVLTHTWAAGVASYPPGNRGIPWIGETLAFMAANNSSKGFYDFVATRHIRYGNCFKTSILGETHVFVSSIEAAKVILSCDSIDFSKRYIRSVAELLGDQSLLCASHEQHKLTRRRISNLFTLDSMASSINMFDELTMKTLCSWKQKGNVVVFNEALKVTFTAICKMLISLEEEDELEMLRKDVFEVSEAMLAFPLKLLGTRYYRGVKARKKIDDTLRKIIASRRKGLEHHEDFLQWLLVRDESLHDDPWTDAQILDNILTLIIAGQITTASAIAWMVKYLDENQEVQDRLRALHLELALKLSHSPLGLEALNEMPYACKIVKESLRMATIVSWFPRVALKDCQIGGFQIKKGWIVNVDARSIHYDPAVNDDPVKFNPSRFDEDPKPYSFLAFGTGGRTCLGMNLAKAMMLVFLHRLVITFRWKVTDPDSSLEKWAMFPRLRSGCPIHVIGGVETEYKLP